MIKLIATALPTTLEEFKTALDCAMAVGQINNLPKEGYVLVPITPTVTMRTAMSNAVAAGYTDVGIWKQALEALKND